jgi:GH15 family glucan-1,4-alpha-glucosidase
MQFFHRFASEMIGAIRLATKKIEDYALIGDCETAALVHRNGSVDWLCWPNFSSPACFAALLGSRENGFWQIAPSDPDATFTRRYRPHTLILETTMDTASGNVLVTDFMPIRGRHSDLVRTVHCTAGRVKMRFALCLRFDYGSTIPWIHFQAAMRGESAWVSKAGPNLTVLRTASLVEETEPGTLAAEFTMHAGQMQTFVLTYGCSYEELPDPIEVDVALQQTEHFWTNWLARNKYQGPYGAAVERSLITLKAMTYRPSGGIVAAPTTSLPERIGGPLNWDYRYCWIRDATLTLSALIECGFTEEVIAWKQWLLRAVGRSVSQVQIMYGIGGERHIADWEVPWLAGYEGSAPVRVGNAAQQQTQQDIYGEIAAALHHAREAGVPCEQEELQLQHALTAHLAKIWKEPGSGMWESRGKPRRYTYSVAMAWLALAKAVASIERDGMHGPLAEWKALRDKIHADVCKHGFDSRLGSFVQHYGARDLDASALLLMDIGFLPATDPRMLGTVKAIEQRLLRDGFLLRNIPDSKDAKQGAFLACSFWLVEGLTQTGRTEEARVLFERLLAIANDVGLLSEEYDTGAKRLTGNFPQAFSHIALVRAAIRLSSSGQ